jgi:hypothetical protein
MFRPSQTLLVRPMPTLNKFILHPPLPLNPRESKQLLNLLSTSFRQTLDKEHGFRTESEIESAVKGPDKHNGTPRPRRLSHSDLDRPPTDRHMRSILTNPLFTSSPTAQHVSNADKDPMEVFDQAAAKGMMNTQYARACLLAKKREIIQSPVLSVREGMRDSGAGLKVLRWLVSSGTAKDNDFLQDAQFAMIFMQYVVAEQLQEVSWKWIKRAFEDYPRLSKLSGLERAAARRALVRPLMCLVKAEASGPVSLDAAYMCLSRAAGYLKGVPAPQMRELLGPPGWFLSYETTWSHSDHLPASESAFDSFIALVPVISREVDYHFAKLNLLHPTRPSVDPALAFLKKLDAPQAADATPLYRWRSTYGREIISLGLNAAKFLLETERFDDAQWVMEYLRAHYPRRLGLAQREQQEEATAEASSLQLLEGLTLA